MLEKIKKMNPIWIPFLTFWIPGQIAKIQGVDENIKTVIIWAIILVQVYFLYKGINHIKIKNQAGERNAIRKTKRDSEKTK